MKLPSEAPPTRAAPSSNPSSSASRSRPLVERQGRRRRLERRAIDAALDLDDDPRVGGPVAADRPLDALRLLDRPDAHVDGQRPRTPGSRWSCRRSAPPSRPRSSAGDRVGQRLQEQHAARELRQRRRAALGLETGVRGAAAKAEPEEPVALARDLGGAVEGRLEDEDAAMAAAPARACSARDARAADLLVRDEQQRRLSGPLASPAPPGRPWRRRCPPSCRRRPAPKRGRLRPGTGTRRASRGPRPCRGARGSGRRPRRSPHRRPGRRRVPGTGGSRPRHPVRAGDRGSRGPATKHTRRPRTGSPGRRGTARSAASRSPRPSKRDSQSRGFTSPLPRSASPARRPRRRAPGRTSATRRGTPSRSAAAARGTASASAARRPRARRSGRPSARRRSP